MKHRCLGRAIDVLRTRGERISPDDLATLRTAFPGNEPTPVYHPRGGLLYYEMAVERP